MAFSVSRAVLACSCKQRNLLRRPERPVSSGLLFFGAMWSRRVIRRTAQCATSLRDSVVQYKVWQHPSSSAPVIYWQQEPVCGLGNNRESLVHGMLAMLRIYDFMPAL